MSKPTKTTPNTLSYPQNIVTMPIKSKIFNWLLEGTSQNWRFEGNIPKPPTLAFKQHQSLRNKLVKAKLPTTEDNGNVQGTTKEPPNTLSQICGTSTQLKNPNIPIYTGKQPPTFQHSWIRRLATMQPLGMNFILRLSGITVSRICPEGLCKRYNIITSRLWTTSNVN